MRPSDEPIRLIRNEAIRRRIDARRSLEELFASNQQQGQQPGHRQPYVCPLGRDAAMITVHWIGRWPDQSVLWDFRDSYLLADDDGRWKILGDVVHNDGRVEPAGCRVELTIYGDQSGRVPGTYPAEVPDCVHTDAQGIGQALTRPPVLRSANDLHHT
jgi:hypothetical protein